jgi:antitoxin component of RelBE/YafQ-DinJ toxin-antitoxin module
MSAPTDNIRIRIPKHLKQQFKESRGHGDMTELLKGVIHTSLHGANLPKMAKKPPTRVKSGAGTRTKHHEKSLKKSDGYIRFLIDKETKEEFKLYCRLQGTTMSNYLRGAVEEVLREEVQVFATASPVSANASRQTATPQLQLDIGQMWQQTFGNLCA